MSKSPVSHFLFQEFNFSSYMGYKREGFVGRKWFFSELERIFEENNESVAGVLITGAPGSGKTALMSQLICSPYSSLLIHENTIGYHLCEYSEKGKRDGARFVRNLVDQIAAQLPEYSKHVMNNEQIRTELNSACHKDPASCFFSTIVAPLRMLRQPDSPRFIIIDGLDECFESGLETSEIMEILERGIPHFPKWLKLILTSRNVTSVTSRLPQRQINRMPLYSTDERNVDDIRYYVSRVISQNTDFSDRLLTAMKIGSRTNGLKIFLDEMIMQAEGNFLFVKMTLQYMNDTGGKIYYYSLPESLFDLYNSFFNRQFVADGFGAFRPLFEVLLTLFSPLPLEDIQEILKIEYKMENIPKRIDEVSCFLRFGSDGTIRLFHQSFADWLINKTAVLSTNKTRGNQNIARFLLRRISERHIDVAFEELTKLFMHILSGQASEMQETAMDLFNITEMLESQTNQSILHYLVTKPSIYLPALNFFSQKFQTVNVLDAKNKTPAFYAASEGFVRSLQCCIDNGADISSFMEGYTEIDPVSVLVRNTGIEEFSLMHAAAAKGHADVVELLIKRNISFPNASKSYPTPLHLAAGNGHSEVVKLFYDHGATFDPIMLHHAAARNHSAVVVFLLHTVGLRDTCIPCEPEHFSLLSLKPTMLEAHMHFCETALHAAVSRGLNDIVKILLAYGEQSIECTHHSGKTVLMDAVERNDTEMVDLLLRHGANVTTECGRQIVKDSNKKMCSKYAMDKQMFLYTLYCVNDSCECGNRAIHISAKYGLWKMAEKITGKRVLDSVDLLNCGNDSALQIAIHYDQARFVQNFNSTLNKLGQYLVPSVMVKLAVTYCSADVVNLYLNHPVNYQVKNVWDLLLQSVAWSPCEELKPGRISSYCLKAFQDSNLSVEEMTKKESERRLHIIKLSVETRQRELLVSYRKDDGLTLLHYAAFHGFEDAVKYLVKLGADINLKDKYHNTPLMIAVKKSPINDLHPSASHRYYTTNDGEFRSCNTTCYDEIARHLIRLQRASISKCDHESSFLLRQVILKRMPLSLYALLKIGVDVNCHDNGTLSPLAIHILNGGSDEVSEVLKMFEVDVFLKCGVPFISSELHLISYVATSGDFGNFFRPSLKKRRFSLQRLIDCHPRGVRILDECYDAEGYLPIHRAAQGGNLAAIKWFKSIGVNTQLKTHCGHTALDISTMGLKKKNSSNLSIAEPFVKINLKNQNECFEELLRTFFDTSYKNYSSDFSFSSFAKHPILHFASKTGLEVFIHVYKKALEIIPSLKRNKFFILDEQDEYGNTPLHIAALSGREDVVKYLVRLGADVNIKNKLDDTPLWIALAKSPYFWKLDLDQLCHTTNDGVFTSCKTTRRDEIERYLLWSQKSSILKCDAKSALLLNRVTSKGMRLSLNALLKIPIGVNYQEKISPPPFLEHIRERSEEVTNVLKIVQMNVSVKYGVFSNSLELISYVATPGGSVDFFGGFFVGFIVGSFDVFFASWFDGFFADFIVGSFGVLFGGFFGGWVGRLFGRFFGIFCGSFFSSFFADIIISFFGVSFVGFFVGLFGGFLGGFFSFNFVGFFVGCFGDFLGRFFGVFFGGFFGVPFGAFFGGFFGGFFSGVFYCGFFGGLFGGFFSGVFYCGFFGGFSTKLSVGFSSTQVLSKSFSSKTICDNRMTIDESKRMTNATSILKTKQSQDNSRGVFETYLVHSNTW
jgi:ankyrin repeat protein